MKTDRLISSLIVSAILTCSMVFSVLSQQKKKPDDDVIKIGTELVQIDVMVTDKHRQPVSGLTRDDFEIYDNDKLQHVTHFSYEKSRSGRSGDDALPRAIASGELTRVLAFVIDTLHMTPESIYRTRKMLQNFIDTKMSSGDLVLILPTGGGSGFYQQFTSDQRVLRSAVSRLRPSFILDNDTPARRSGTPQQVLELLPALAEARAGVPQAAGQGGLGAAGNIAGLIEEADARVTMNVLNTLIASMSRLPGRKIGVFISEGFRTYQTGLSQEMTEVTSKAARSNVIFYSIDPAGLAPLSVTAGDQIADISRGPLEVDTSPNPNNPTGLVTPSGMPHLNTIASERRSGYFESQDALNALAVDTGGRFFRNNNDISSGLTNLLEENSAYYLLGFQPEAGKWDGKFHKIKVVVRGRDDLIVSTRKGYLARSEEDPKKSKRRSPLTREAAEIMEEINSPLVRRDIDLQVTGFYRDDEKREPVMTSLLHIDAARLNFKQAGGKYKTKIEVIGFVLDVTGRAVASFNKTADLDLDPQLHQALLGGGLLTVRSDSVKPGVYQIKALVRESGSGFIGTASSYVEIPDMKSDRLAVSSIFTDAQLLRQEKGGDVTGVGSPLARRHFPRNGQMGYVLIAYNAKTGGKEKAPQLEMMTRILKGDRVVFNGQLKPVEILEGSDPPSRIITGGIIQLSGLAPDDYTLEVTIVDKLRKKEDALARQEIDFSVE